jgi:phosphatidylglycerol lysyltransferase
MTLKRLFNPSRRLILNAVAYIVALDGLIIIADNLFRDLNIGNVHHLLKTSGVLINLPILFGLTLIYLSTLLRRYKRTAWGVTVLVYAFMLGINAVQLADLVSRHPHFVLSGLIRLLILPLGIVTILVLCRQDFTTKSDTRSFRSAVRFAVVILSVTLIYGTAGFMLMDQHDFHQEISFPEAIHRTIDQFDLTTSRALKPYTRRAQVFLDSLSFISVVSLGYVAISFFQPLRARLEANTAADRAKLKKLLDQEGGDSEDIFKLWPEDKLYFFNQAGTAGLAYKVQHGIALVVGNPVGERKTIEPLLAAFNELCFTNDWAVAFIHSQPKWNQLFKKVGFTTQKIGEEAVVNIDHFYNHTRHDKYFRNIINRFDKLGYSSQLLLPPHDDQLLAQLTKISNDWLKLPGRTERGFAMGYFSKDYMQRSNIFVARDKAGNIKAFLNQIQSFDKQEANFDLLRYEAGSPGNINDFVLVSFLDYLHLQTKFSRLNLGLCPLAGLNQPSQESRNMVNSLLQFVYSNGSRFYSFNGLYRFKAKYLPQWNGRYVIYRGGLRSFTAAMNALMRAMRIKA